MTRLLLLPLQKAGKVQDIPNKEDKKDDPDDFIPKPDPNRKANNIGVKVGKRYVSKKRMAKIIACCVIAAAVVLFFFPPVVTNNTDESSAEKKKYLSDYGSY